MIKTQILREGRKPVAVVLDYEEYKRLKELAEDKEDFTSAMHVKMTNKTWKDHIQLKQELGL
jgi:hypothetical protein